LAVEVERALGSLIATHLQIPQEALERDIPLNEFGFDSITLASFGQILNHRYGLELSPTVFFEAPTIEALTAYLLREHRSVLAGAFVATQRSGPTVASPEEQAPPAKGRRRGRRPSSMTGSALMAASIGCEPIAVIGMSGRYPKADNLQIYWQNLIEGRDCIEEIPSERWPLDGFYTQDRKSAIAQGLSYCKWGGFIRTPDPSDDDFFIFTQPDSRPLDTVQRVFLETVWNALESAGYTRATLNEFCQSRVGVYVGASLSLQQSLDKIVHDEITETGGALSSLISRFFGLSGPSIAIDAHSASSMAAIHTACVSLAHKECDLAIAGGVSLLSAGMYKSACRLNLTGSHINSRSFAEGRDGMLPSDGAGVVLLKPLSNAVRDNDNILAVLRSTISSYVDSSIYADALAVSSTPSPHAIARTIKDNVIKSGVDPRTISYVESAAPGLPVGDALEVAAMSKAFKEFTADQRFCALGSVTSNIGHAVAASGVSKLAKVILQMQHRQLAPHIKASPMGSDLGLETSPFYLQQEACEWRRPRLTVDGVEQEFPRRAMVNSLGYGGFYAGAIIEEFAADSLPNYPDAAETCGEPQLILLSAKSAERLQTCIQELCLWVESRKQLRLSDVAYTLQVGREPMPYRWAALVNSRDELLRALSLCSRKEFVDLPTGSGTLFRGLVSQTSAELQDLLDGQALDQILARYVAERNCAKLAAWWVKGARVPWNDLHKAGSSRRVWLPAYPFGANGS
jgi:polyketide synthase PksN